MHDLSTLDNDDKHIILTPTISVMEISNFVIVADNGQIVGRVGHMKASGGNIDAAMFGGVGFKFEPDTEVSFSIEFDQIPALKDAAVIDTLCQFSGGVAGIVREATNLFG